MTGHDVRTRCQVTQVLQKRDIVSWATLLAARLQNFTFICRANEMPGALQKLIIISHGMPAEPSALLPSAIVTPYAPRAWHLSPLLSCFSSASLRKSLASPLWVNASSVGGVINMENGVRHAQVSCESVNTSCTCNTHRLLYLSAAVLAVTPSPRYTQAPRRYLTYLPQDNDGLANAQSEQVLRVMNEDLEELLSSSDADFWEVLATEGSLITCLDSFLRFARCCFLATHPCDTTFLWEMHLRTENLWCLQSCF